MYIQRVPNNLLHANYNMSTRLNGGILARKDPARIPQGSRKDAASKPCDTSFATEHTVNIQDATHSRYKRVTTHEEGFGPGTSAGGLDYY